MNEAETRAELIDPALREAGWGMDEGSRIHREVIVPGRLVGNGRRAPAEFADYVLSLHGHKLAVIEAKKRSEPVTLGLAQAKNYAEKLEIRFAYSTNGDGIYRVDRLTGQEGYIEAYPTPDQLWQATYPTQNIWRDRFAAVPFEDKGGNFEARYYQHTAIQHVLAALEQGQRRILLTMATGTGKTFVAFQIAWKLFQSRWNLSGEPIRRPRILFLADRNILANQAFNGFSAFPEDALIRIDPDAIRKLGRVPKNGSIFFTIFQTFMAGRNDQGDPIPNFGDYPSNFFDFIVVDECHRGGANNESTWRSILDHFAPAVHLGLTATPKRNDNVDTYAYFGEPVFSYSLKAGINDGYLTPFKVRKIQTDLDEYYYSPDDDIIAGEIDQERTYTESDFNRVIEIEERERYRVRLFMEEIDQNQKTLVFCANQPHALFIRDLINQIKISADPNYCVRVTADDGSRGELHLRNFQDNEKTIPTILTTSQKLSTGVDARNVRNIVFLRPINSLIEFKQIVGRGTRLYEGKDYFTIYDFVQAYEHFKDPEWDGEPLEPPPPKSSPSTPRERHTPLDENQEETETTSRRPTKIVVRLSDGKERTLSSRAQTTFWSPDGKPISAAEFVEQLFGDIPTLFRDETELRHLWSRPDTRKALLEGLSDRGYGEEQLTEISRLVDAENSDLYDVLAYIAYARKPITRQERVISRQPSIFASYTPKQQEFLEFVLDSYIRAGFRELDREKLPILLELKYGGVRDASSQLGAVSAIKTLFEEFQKHLYEEQEAA